MTYPIQRRRRQLRVAQQAYRRRKANTIGNLQDRVYELEGGIEQLSQSFLAFSDLLLKIDRPERYTHVTSALHKITQQCVSLAKTGCHGPDEGALVKAPGITQGDIDQHKSLSNSYRSTPPNEEDPIRLSPPSPIQSSELPVPSIQPAYHEQSALPFDLVVAPPAIEFHGSLSLLPSQPPDTALTSLAKKERWTFSQRLVKICCQNGYRLLIDTPTDVVKVRERFGPSIPPIEYNRLVSCLYAGMKDENGDLIDQMATVLDRTRPMRHNCTSEEPITPHKTWGIADEACEWLDASGVQKLLRDRGFCIQKDGFLLSSSHLQSSLHVATFTERGFSASRKLR